MRRLILAGLAACAAILALAAPITGVDVPPIDRHRSGHESIGGVARVAARSRSKINPTV